MSQKKVTLVLGAGSSLSFGYPLGEDLCKQILSMETWNHEALSQCGFSIHSPSFNDMREFIDVFRRSASLSIDSFLARRPQLVDVGKRAIAACLLSLEKTQRLIYPHDVDLWHRYFLNAITQSDWENLDFSWLTIVTFNYDRSLEHFLVMALGARYGKSEEDVLQKMARLKIIHVYGSLGATLPTESNRDSYVPYGSQINQERIAVVSSFLRVIPEGRADEAEIDVARKLLKSADVIAFLGFSYDQANLHLLNAKRTCSKFVIVDEDNGGWIPRRIVGTVMGLTSAEKSLAVNMTAGVHPSKDSLIRMQNDPGKDFYPGNCISLLRETLILNFEK